MASSPWVQTRVFDTSQAGQGDLASAYPFAGHDRERELKATKDAFRAVVGLSAEVPVPDPTPIYDEPDEDWSEPVELPEEDKVDLLALAAEELTEPAVPKPPAKRGRPRKNQ